MHFECLPVCLMQPGNEYYLLSHYNVPQALCKGRVDFQPGIGRSFRTLPGRSIAAFQVGSDETNWANRISNGLGHTPAYLSLIDRSFEEVFA